MEPGPPNREIVLFRLCVRVCCPSEVVWESKCVRHRLYLLSLVAGGCILYLV